MRGQPGWVLLTNDDGVDAPGLVPSSIRAAVARGCATCGTEPSLSAREDGSLVHITVSRAR